MTGRKVTFKRKCAGEYLAHLDGKPVCWLYYNPHDLYWYPEPSEFNLMYNIPMVTEHAVTTRTLKDLKECIRAAFLDVDEVFDYD